MLRACTGTLLQLLTCADDANCAVRRKFNLAAAEGGRPKGRRRRPEMAPKSAACQGGASAFVVYSMPGSRQAHTSRRARAPPRSACSHHARMGERRDAAQQLAAAVGSGGCEPPRLRHASMQRWLSSAPTPPAHQPGLRQPRVREQAAESAAHRSKPVCRPSAQSHPLLRPQRHPVPQLRLLAARNLGCHEPCQPARRIPLVAVLCHQHRVDGALEPLPRCRQQGPLLPDVLGGVNRR